MILKAYGHLAHENIWTKAISTAVEDLCRQGGGTLSVPAGLYHTGPIELKSNITLHLDAGAVLAFIDDPACYPLVDLEFEGIAGKAYMPCVYANHARRVRITGDGTLEGNGARWWKLVREKALSYPRPYLVCFHHCQDVVIDHVLLQNSPSWTVHPLYCDHVTINHVTIRNPFDSPNTDGIDPDSSRNVLIEGCLIDVGDDCIAIKAGTENTPERRSCENIIITGCHMQNGHGGVVIGSEMSGSVRNVQVSGCIFHGTDRGIRIKTRRLRGGVVENLQFSHILMEDVMCPFVINMFYFCGKDGKLQRVWDKAPYSVDASTPAIRDIAISDVTVRNATACAGFFYGLPERPVERLSLNNCTVIMKHGKAAYPAMMDGITAQEGAGFFLRNGKDIRFRDVLVENAKGGAVDADDSVYWKD